MELYLSRKNYCFITQ